MKIKSLLSITALAVTTSLSYAKDTTTKPNVIVIMADDLGYNDTGFQGSKRIKTPHLDLLASQGTRFTDAHVSASVCSPSRAGFMTGRYQQRFGHEANCPPGEHGMDVNERTLGQAFKDLGYRTALIGKWHLGNMEHQYPTNRGFDVFYGLREGSRNYWHTKSVDKPGNPRAIEYNGKQVNFEGHLTDRFGEQAIKFIEETKDQPFFAFLSFTAPHGPLQSKKEDMEALGTKNNYAGLVYGMDRNIGNVLEALKRTDKLDNTIIWFLSDNGGVPYLTADNSPLGGRKGTKFEGGHRVPFLLYWKGHVPAGKDYNEMVSALDIYSTSVAAAGGTLDQKRPLDGVDLLPYITGEKQTVPHKQLYFRKLECAAIRDGKWKLIRAGEIGLALYNLENDIAEQHNLAAKNPQKLKEMTQALESWETKLMKPIWGEGDYWKKIRLNYHQSWFKTGEPHASEKKKTIQAQKIK